MASLTNLIRLGTSRFTVPVPRAKKDYATHIPALIGLARWKQIRSVLELGSGLYSTATFLNKTSFPDLQVLDSFETDSGWADTMKAVISGDPRASLKVAGGTMAAALSDFQLNNYDLIFIDDSVSAEDRARTILAVHERNPGNSLVVIHDFEVSQYRNVARCFHHRYAFRAFNPETGVAWQNGIATSDAFKKIDAVMKRHADRLEPDDLEGWISAFS